MAVESVITQSSGTAGALRHVLVLFASKEAYKYFILYGRLMCMGCSQLMLPFVVCNGLQALPHLTSVRASVVRFDLSPVFACLIVWRA